MNREEFQRTIEKYEGVFNPYQVKQGDVDSTRISIDVPSDTHQLLRIVTIDKGFFQRSLAMFIYCLEDYCKQTNILTYSPLNAKELYDFIRQRCALVGAAGNGRHENDGRPAAGTTPKVTRSRKQRAIVTRGDSTEGGKDN